jgi:hypothetical protein
MSIFMQRMISIGFLLLSMTGLFLAASEQNTHLKTIVVEKWPKRSFMAILTEGKSSLIT